MQVIEKLERAEIV